MKITARSKPNRVIGASLNVLWAASGAAKCQARVVTSHYVLWRQRTLQRQSFISSTIGDGGSWLGSGSW